MAGQLKGTSRMTTSFQVGQLENEELQNALTLYKQPSTIRDMKQVYFYTEVHSILTNVEPIRMFYSQWGRDGPAPLPPFDDTNIRDTCRNFYFGNIGTTKEFDISEKINSLMDIRVPKDKYVIEINLAECTIEADSSGWVANPDYGVVFASPLNEPPTLDDRDGRYLNLYNFTDQQGDPIGNPPFSNLTQTLTQATKLTSPQTLFCRIKELSNGEPYNWSVTNSGDYSIDKSHQLLVRHGDINYSKLTLEYGHLVFRGLDAEYFNDLRDTFTSTNTQEGNPGSSLNGRFSSDLVNNERFNQPYYIDYNREVFNTTDIPGYDSIVGDDEKEARISIYPSYYKGLGGLPVYGKLSNGDKYVPSDNQLIQAMETPLAGGSNLVTPVNRPPYFFIGNQDFLPDSGQPGGQPAVYDGDGFGIQGRPLFYSQQAHKIGFRFLIRVIALF